MNVRSRDWCININNYTEEELIIMDDMSTIATYLVYGKEIAPTTGTPHVHLYVYFPNAKTFERMKKFFPRARIEKTAGNTFQASMYCKKGEQSHEEWEKYGVEGENFGKNADFKEYGELPDKQGKRTDLDNVRQVLSDTGRMSEVVAVAKSNQSVRMAQEILKYHEKKRDWKPQVMWFYGATGTGKSKTAYEILGDDCYTTMDTGKWWEGYDAHESVHIEDMRRDFLKFHQLLKLLDRYPYRIECKGGSRQFLAKRIIITSCYSPYEMFETREDIQQLIRRIDEIRKFE